MSERKLCIIGTGGFGREALCCFIDQVGANKHTIGELACFMVDDEHLSERTIMGCDVLGLSEFDPEKYKVVVAIGDPKTRKKVVENLPSETVFTSIIHPNAVVSEWVNIGDGAIITAGCVFTCNITIGKHAHVNLNSTIGHDCEIGDYFTTAPAANISGNCNFGDCVYFGTKAAVRQGIEICDDVTIGMGAIVVKPIAESGVYIGSPAKKMERK